MKSTFSRESVVKTSTSAQKSELYGGETTAPVTKRQFLQYNTVFGRSSSVKSTLEGTDLERNLGEVELSKSIKGDRRLEHVAGRPRTWADVPGNGVTARRSNPD